MSRFADLEGRIAHRFADAGLLERALTHRSAGPEHNERLEFLGDGVLGCAIAEALVQRYPHLDEGTLTRMRASLVRERTLAELARELGVPGWLRLGEGAATGAGVPDSILADALEALYGAVFLDGGYAAARAAIRETLGPRLETAAARGPEKDAKTRLQEYLQGQRLKLPAYGVVATQGAAHARRFEVRCTVEALGLEATGTGRSRRAAEQEAARALLERLHP